MATKTERTLDIDIDPIEVKEEILRKYPVKVARKRAKQMIVNKVDEAQTVPEIQANVRTIPGILTMRGCAYAGCKGVVLGPTRDILQITHGPIGCGFYSWLTRRNQTRPKSATDTNFMPYAMSTDMQEEEIIFGGEKKLKKAIEIDPMLAQAYYNRGIGYDKQKDFSQAIADFTKAIAINPKYAQAYTNRGSEGVYVYRLDSSTGGLKYVTKSPRLNNPSFVV